MPEQIKTKAEFDTILKSNPKVLVDFTASWCGPCKMIAPVFEQLAGENPEVKFIKVDVDENGEAAQEMGVQAMPTFMAFHNGAKVEEFAGANAEKLKTMVAGLKAK